VIYSGKEKGPEPLSGPFAMQRMADVDCSDVIADLKGREQPDQVVIVSGHLDSSEF
jgi:carboxypeptidase Q